MDYTSKIKNVCLYARKSRLNEDADEAKTLDNQLKIMENFINSKGWNYKLYAEVVSGGETSRPQFELMLTDIIQGMFDGVAAVDLDRLSRNSLDFARLKEACISTGTYIITPQGITNPAIAEDNLSASILALMSEFELSQFKKRVRRAKIQKAKEGNWVIGLAPIGYIRNDKTGKLIVDKDSVEVVLSAFKMASEGKSLKDIMSYINGLGYLTRRNNRFTPTSILHLLTNPVYIGKIIYKPGAKSKSKYDESFQTIEAKNSHEAIIDRDIWYKVQDGLKSRRKKPKRSRHLTHALSSLVFCGKCGYSMNIYRNNAGNIYIRNCNKLYPDGSFCTNSGCKHEDLLNAIINLAKSERDRLQDVNTHLSILEDERNLIQSKIAISENNIKKYKAALENIDLQFEEGIYTKEKYMSRRAARMQQISQEEENINRFREALESLDNTKPILQLNRFNDFLENFDHYYSLYKEEYGEEASKNLNLLIQSIISKIIITREPKPKGTNQRYDPNPIYIHVVYK